ncbi:methyltransferase domain-containing protein [Sphingomonas sp.]|uniref:methyltransferase domain-containing protein n=1 Tax=Sphingomonas sp. TaxID=28214 RepID=UPI000DB381EF|nr:methyltransferase domain-containing protein [Sphingomonas sp.]PZU08225.1 MAG: hypothetical protein DI605_13365 [Sphingomonas sp.]
MSVLRGHELKARLTQPRDEWWDRRLGVKTFGYHGGSGEWGTADWASHYQPLSYAQIFAGLAAAELSPEDVFTDLGCGLGRALFAAAHAGAGRAVGVELVPELARAAEANRRRSRLLDRDIRIVEANALDHPLGDTSLLYFFHALSAQILAQVIANIRAAREAAPPGRPLRIVYANPVFDDVLAASGWLDRVRTIPAEPERFSSVQTYGISIWRSAR